MHQQAGLQRIAGNDHVMIARRDVGMPAFQHGSRDPLMHADGTGLVRLTDDAARDWAPRFTPDGSAVTFYSNSGGKYDAYSIRTDGSGRTRLTNDSLATAYAMFAPDGKRLVVAVIPNLGMIGTAPWPMTRKSAKTLLDITVPGGRVVPTYWSRGGRWISGYVNDTTHEVTGQAVIDAATLKARQLNSDSRGHDLAWLPDDRHVVYFTNQGTLVMQDVVTLERRTVAGVVAYPPEGIGFISASPDGHTLYYGARQTEANIWVVRHAAPPTH